MILYLTSQYQIESSSLKIEHLKQQISHIFKLKNQNIINSFTQKESNLKLELSTLENSLKSSTEQFQNQLLLNH